MFFRCFVCCLCVVFGLICRVFCLFLECLAVHAFIGLAIILIPNFMVLQHVASLVFSSQDCHCRHGAHSTHSMGPNKKSASPPIGFGVSCFVGCLFCRSFARTLQIQRHTKKENSFTLQKMGRLHKLHNPTFGSNWKKGGMFPSSLMMDRFPPKHDSSHVAPCCQKVWG